MTRKDENLTALWALNAVDTHHHHHIVETPPARTTVEIPVTCYQLIGVPDRAEKDEVVKSVMDLKSAEIEEGYTMDAVGYRRIFLRFLNDFEIFYHMSILKRF
ncbi:plastid division protein CDP1, chloroplastic-like [Rosa chinensis]|uniref:plastid division protein CDP1, chloroplastic-like n=1 Tax=Rosa chinensis TaxID=74649 RepID=UPI000D090C77|nr:plastid division protein CDP1, chloroplastic-like [Rosa chinensis]